VQLNQPSGIAVDNIGNVYIAGDFDATVYKVNSSGIINVIAGGSKAQYFPGDGKPADSVAISEPVAVALDSHGNIYIVDQGSDNIRMVNNFGIISTIAGNGTSGFSGDGGPAAAAEFNTPTGITLDASGNIYIADQGNNRIRKLSTICANNGFDLTGALSICIDTPTFSSASIDACIYNNRCKVMKGQLKLILDTAIHIATTVADSAARISGDTLIWNFDSLSYFGKTGCVNLTGNVSSIPKGDSVFVTLIIAPSVGDSLPSNNKITYWVKAFPYNCVGLPFDPNEKSVYPVGDISPTQQLTYTIHFQNTGTAVAHDIVVVDTLSPYLDPTTFKVISSSREVNTSVSSGHIITFTFDNINLVDTGTSKTQSIGMVQYTINPKSITSPGDVIKNKAGIYFDANTVVLTNTTINTIASGIPTGMVNLIAPIHIACFPNPFTSSTSIVFNAGGKHYLELDDITGRKIETIECNGPQYELQRNDLAPGIYFIKAFDTDHKYIATNKLVIQ
jgi:uncharacterized repeat protein (TIGR01451 family)